MKNQKDKVSNPCESFYRILSKERFDIDNDLNNKQIESKTILITQKLNDLSEEQAQQWKEIYINKIRQQYKQLIISSFKSESKFLRYFLKMFILICSTKDIQYNLSQFAKMLKDIYLGQYDQSIRNILIKAGFSMQQEVLQYNPKSGIDKVMYCFCYQLD